MGSTKRAILATDAIRDEDGRPWVVVVIREGPNEVVADFALYEVCAWESEDDMMPLLERKGCVNPLDNPTTNPDEAHACAHGSVKWDGCVDWSTNEDVMVHACDRLYVERFTSALLLAYDLASAQVKPRD